MIIVGELINASRKRVRESIESQDRPLIQRLAKDQSDAGADYIDVNAGVFVDEETDYLKWLVDTVQSEVDCPCCIDSPSPEAIEAALGVHKGTAMINSISQEKERFDRLIPLIAGTDLKIVALCMGDAGMPETAEARIRIADDLITRLTRNNIPIENIYVDPLVQPVAANKVYGIEFLNAVGKIMTDFPGVHTICGLSNVSYGLPERKLLNRSFMIMALSRGLDVAVLDPLDKQMMTAIIAAEALTGTDDFCMNYLNAYRGKKLVA